MSALPSIRKRLLVALGVLTIVWCLAVSLVVGWVVQHEIDELLDQALQESGEVLLGALSSRADELSIAKITPMQTPAHVEQLVWQIVGPDGAVLLRSQGAPESALGATQAKGFLEVQSHWRVYAMPFEGRGRMLYVGQVVSERTEARMEAVGYAIGAALLVGAIAVFWMSASLRRELQSLLEMSQSVATFDPLTSNVELAPPDRDELRPMHAAIVNFGQRLAHKVANERAFAGHAAHALRTPLAAMMTNLSVAQRRAGPDAQIPLKRAQESADRLRRVVSALLTMFRSGAQLRCTEVNVEDIVDELAFDGLSVVPTAGCRVYADPDLLAAALWNLIDNAIRHGATVLQVATFDTDDLSCIRLQDNGSGMSEATRLKMQNAIDTQHYEGATGLGLMLADMVARAHGGRVVLLPSAHGCCIELCLGRRTSIATDTPNIEKGQDFE